MRWIRLTKRRFWKVVNTGDTGRCIYYIAITRKQIEAGNIAPALRLLTMLRSNLDSLLLFEKKIDINITGYENDKRDLWDIKEVRNYMELLDRKFPFWFHFLRQAGDSSLPFLTLCLVDYRKKNRFEYGVIKNNKLFNFLDKHVSALAAILEEIGCNESIMYWISGIWKYYDQLFNEDEESDQCPCGCGGTSDFCYVIEEYGEEEI